MQGTWRSGAGCRGLRGAVLGAGDWEELGAGDWEELVAEQVNYVMGLGLGKCSTVRITVQFLLRVRIAQQVRTSRSLVKQGSNESRECTQSQTENLPING